MEHDAVDAVAAAIAEDLTGEEPEGEAFDALVSELREHGDRSAIVHRLMRSEAYLAREVDSAYRRVLDRQATADEFAEHRQAVLEGAYRAGDLPLHLLRWVADHSPIDAAAFRGLVRDVTLGSILTVDPGVDSRAPLSVAERRALATEAWTAKRALEHRTAQLFRRHLWRDPDPSGLRTESARLHQYGDGDVSAMLVSSTEYTRLALRRRGHDLRPPVQN